MAERARLAVVTGGNRGIGLAVCRGLARQGLRVVLTARSLAKAREAQAKLAQEGLEVEVMALDVADEAAAAAFAAQAEEAFGPVDVLVNNAGVALDGKGAGDWEGGSVLEARTDKVKETLQTNLFGPLLLCQAFAPRMAGRGYGRIINVSSGMGQLSDMNGGFVGYRLSKAGLNVLTRVLADELKGRDVQINSVCPGWVHTDMGGPHAPRTPEQGADTIIWLATQPPGGPSGGFFRDRKPIPW